MESMAKKHEEKKAEKKLPEEKKNKGKKEQRRQQTTGRVCILNIWKEDKRTRVGQKEERKGEKRRAFLLILFSHFLPSLLSLCAELGKENIGTHVLSLISLFPLLLLHFSLRQPHCTGKQVVWLKFHHFSAPRSHNEKPGQNQVETSCLLSQG